MYREPPYPPPLLFLLLLLLNCILGRACTGKIDLIFCVDASGSVDGNCKNGPGQCTGEWGQQTDFVKGFIDDFTGNGGGMSEKGIKIGIMTFAYKNVVNIALSSNYGYVMGNVETRTNGETNTHLCINAAVSALSSTAAVAAPAGETDTQRGVSRAGATKLIVLITDGSPTCSSCAASAAAAAKNAGVTVIGVGVDTGLCYCPCPCLSSGDKSIKQMVSDPKDDNYVRVDDFDKLSENLKKITDLTCPVGCQGDWDEWSACSQATGTRSRTFKVSQAAIDGGDACPQPQTEPCSIDCGYSFSGWSPCANVNGASVNIGPYQQSRTVTVKVPPKNGGKACPPDETRNCAPSVCYSVDSPATEFTRIGKVKAIETLPPNHPGRTRTDCGGAVTDAMGIPEPNDGPCGNTPPQLFYDLSKAGAGTQNSLNGVASVGAAHFFFVRDASARHTYFAVQNGAPSGGSGGKLTLKLRFTAAGSWTLPATVGMPVKDEPGTSTAGSTCNALGSVDCYDEFDESLKGGNVHWSWAAGETSGAMFGPLPVFGYCVKLNTGDAKGLGSGYKVMEYVGGGGFATAKPIPNVAFDYGVTFCVDLCDCEGEECGTPPPGAGDMCGGVPCVEGGGGLAAGETANQNPGGGGNNGNGGDDSSGNSNGDGTGNDNSNGNNGPGGIGDNVNGDNGDDTSARANTPSGTDNSASDTDGSSTNDGGAGGIVAGLVVTALACGLLIMVGVLVVKRKRDKANEGIPENRGLPPGWEAYIDKASGAPCYEHAKTGQTSWDRPPGSKPVVRDPRPAIAMVSVNNPMRNGKQKAGRAHARTVTELPPGWTKDFDSSQNAEYFFNEATGEMSWDAPPGTVRSAVHLVDTSAAHVRMQTKLPGGWIKDFDASQNAKYYYNEANGEMSWEPPPGSVGGSAGGGDGGPAVLQSHVRSGTALPPGWGKDVDAEGNQFFYHEATGETSWDKPAV